MQTEGFSGPLEMPVTRQASRTRTPPILTTEYLPLSEGEGLLCSSPSGPGFA